MTLALSYLPTARRLHDLSELSPDAALKVIAKHLDFPMDDAETVDFLRQAFREAEKELRIDEIQWRIDRLKDSSHD